jgi:hypothetical protein
MKTRIAAKQQEKFQSKRKRKKDRKARTLFATCTLLFPLN